jgi:hypothetical protein
MPFCFSWKETNLLIHFVEDVIVTIIKRSEEMWYLTEFKTDVSTSYNGNPVRNKFQLECMVTGNYSLPCRSTFSN